MRKGKHIRLPLLGIFFLMVVSLFVFNQKENVVSGKVFPAGLPTPMKDVTVKIEGIDSTAVLTNEGGVFVIHVAEFPVKLEFSKATYKTQVKTVKKVSNITIHMTTSK